MRKFVGVLGAMFGMVGCGPKAPEGAWLGDNPVVFVNETARPICTIGLYVRHTQRILDAKEGGRKGDVCLAPRARQEFHLSPGRYSLSMDDDRSPISFSQDLSVQGATEVVIWDNTPPSGSPPAGYTRMSVETDQHKRAVSSANAQANAKAARSQCDANIPPANERPSPGRTKATGKWKCVIGGAYTGTDYVDLVQLVDGRISATVSGSDRNATWTGAVVGEEVHFRWGDLVSGGNLKLDPSGRAMSGRAHTFTDRNRCEQWTMTCTR